MWHIEACGLCEQEQTDPRIITVGYNHLLLYVLAHPARQARLHPWVQFNVGVTEAGVVEARVCVVYVAEKVRSRFVEIHVFVAGLTGDGFVEELLGGDDQGAEG